MPEAPSKHCIIGAGAASLPIAKKLLELGEDFDILEKQSGIGGLWHDQAHDTAVMISSKKLSQYIHFPIDQQEPLFLNKSQAQAYLQAYADYFGITPHVKLSTEVCRIRPVGNKGDQGWQIELSNGEKRLYKTVAIATGMYSEPKQPPYPGQFTGEFLYSNQYKKPEMLKNKKVLVIGNGNTACDIAVDALLVNATVDISMYRGTYILPKVAWGIPMGDWIYFLPFRSAILEKLGTTLALQKLVGDLTPYGMPKPGFPLFDRHPVLNDRFIEGLKAGRIRIKPDISRWDQQQVSFVDESSSAYDMVVSAIGYKTHYPLFDPEDDILEWQNGMPLLYGRTIVPKWPGLFIAGLGQVRTGGWPIFEQAGYAIARLMTFQSKLPVHIIQAIEALPYVPFFKPYWDFLQICPATTRSRGPAEYYREFAAIQYALDDLNCPSAPSKTGKAYLQNAQA